MFEETYAVAEFKIKMRMTRVAGFQCWFEPLHKRPLTRGESQAFMAAKEDFLKKCKAAGL